jgi:hypothetical protein
MKLCSDTLLPLVVAGMALITATPIIHSQEVSGSSEAHPSPGNDQSVAPLPPLPDVPPQGLPGGVTINSSHSETPVSATNHGEIAKPINKDGSVEANVYHQSDIHDGHTQDGSGNYIPDNTSGSRTNESVGVGITIRTPNSVSEPQSSSSPPATTDATSSGNATSQTGSSQDSTSGTGGGQSNE